MHLINLLVKDEVLLMEKYVKNKLKDFTNNATYFENILKTFNNSNNFHRIGIIVYIKTVTDENGKILGYTVSEDIKDAEYSYRNDELTGEEFESKENKYIDNAYFIDVEDDYLLFNLGLCFETKRTNINIYKIRYDYNSDGEFIHECDVNIYYEIENEKELRIKYNFLRKRIEQIKILNNGIETKYIDINTYNAGMHQMERELKVKKLDKYWSYLGINHKWVNCHYEYEKTYSEKLGYDFTFGEFCQNENVRLKVIDVHCITKTFTNLHHKY